MSSEVRSGTLRSGSFELAWSVEGNGPAALVIGSAVYYPRTFSRALRKQLRLAFVDHRGFAKLDGEAGVADYALDRILEDTEALRRHLDLGKMIVIGHSGHGYMALEYARKYPEHVSHVVVIGTGPNHSTELEAVKERHWQEAVCPERKAQLEKDLALLPAELEAAPEKRFITFCLRLAARSWYDPAYDAAPLWEGVQVNMPAFDHLWGETFRDIDMRQVLGDVQAPVFIAMGRFDYLVAPCFTWEPYREHCRDLTLRVFDRSGHTPQLEESEAFDAELINWLNRQNV